MKTIDLGYLFSLEKTINVMLKKTGRILYANLTA